MSIETKQWGIRIVRVELKEIEPPKDVQDTMNTVIKAENTKQSAIDFANAKEIEADNNLWLTGFAFSWILILQN